MGLFPAPKNRFIFAHGFTAGAGGLRLFAPRDPTAPSPFATAKRESSEKGELWHGEALNFFTAKRRTSPGQSAKLRQGEVAKRKAGCFGGTFAGRSAELRQGEVTKRKAGWFGRTFARRIGELHQGEAAKRAGDERRHSICLMKASMMGDMLIMVGIPALVAMALYDKTRGRVAKTVKPALDPFAKLGLLLVIVANATNCVPFLKQIDGTLLLVIAATIGLCFFGYFLGFYVGLLQKKPFPVAMSMAINTGMRNTSVGGVLAAQYFPPEVIFPVAFTPLFLQISVATVTRILLRTRQGRAWQAAQQAETFLSLNILAVL